MMEATAVQRTSTNRTRCPPMMYLVYIFNGERTARGGGKDGDAEHGFAVSCSHIIETEKSLIIIFVFFPRFGGKRVGVARRERETCPCLP